MPVIPGTPPRRLQLKLLPARYAIARLAPDAPIPAWARDPTFCVIARTPEELSIVCGEDAVPPPNPAGASSDIRQERGFRILRVTGQLDFEQVGIFASMATPLAEAAISIVPIATFDTDYLLIRETSLPHALEVLRAAGHTIDAA